MGSGKLALHIVGYKRSEFRPTSLSLRLRGVVVDAVVP